MKLGIVTVRIGVNDGQGRVNREIAAEALRQGHDVVLFSEHIDQDMVASKGVRAVIRPPPSWLPSRILRDTVFAFRAQRQIALPENRCDALLTNGFATWTRSDVNAAHFVHSSWAQSAWHPWRLKRSARSLYAWAYSWLHVQLEKDAFRRTGRVVAVSGRIRQELLRAGVASERIVVITNGVDATEFHPGASERERFGLPFGERIALFAGDLKTPRKNLETVLRAVATIPDLHLAVAGRSEGTPYPYLAGLLRITDRVHFLGFQENMPALMRSVDLFVFPSRYEACGLVLLEALASGVPVITSRSAGGSEIITPDVGTVLEDSEDSTLLAAAIHDLMWDDARRTGMSTKARALAQQHSWEVMASRYIDLLLTAAGQHRHGHA